MDSQCEGEMKWNQVNIEILFKVLLLRKVIIWNYNEHPCSVEPAATTRAMNFGPSATGSVPPGELWEM